MSTTSSVDFGGIHVRDSVAELVVYTPSGQARIGTVDERDLIRLIVEAAEALQKLRARRDALQRMERRP